MIGVPKSVSSKSNMCAMRHQSKSTVNDSGFSQYPPSSSYKSGNGSAAGISSSLSHHLSEPIEESEEDEEREGEL